MMRTETVEFHYAPSHETVKNTRDRFFSILDYIHKKNEQSYSQFFISV